MSEWKRTIPAGKGKGTYVLHKIKGLFYWYRHYYDSETKKVKTKREDPPGMDLSGMPYDPPSAENIETWLVQDVKPVLEEAKGESPVPLPEEITQEIDLVIEQLDERIPVLQRSKRSKGARVMQEAKELLEKIKQSL